MFRALADYDRIHELSKRYVESRFIEPAADGTPRIYTKVRGCVWFFCRTVERYARLSLQPETTITATVEPEDSDMGYGVELWELEALGPQTRILYRHEAEPKFWVPPLIGGWAIRRVLSKDAPGFAKAIEQSAERLAHQPVLEGTGSDE